MQLSPGFPSSSEPSPDFVIHAIGKYRFRSLRAVYTAHTDRASYKVRPIVCFLHTTLAVHEYAVPTSLSLALALTPRFFIPSLYLTVLSHTGALPSALILAARAAFLDLAIPKTKVISTMSLAENEDDLSGIKAAVRRKGPKVGRRGQSATGTGAEWELDGGGTEGLGGAENLPVLVTLNMVSSVDVLKYHC